MGVNTKILAKCRGKKLTGIRKYPEDEYCDHNYEGLILVFGVVNPIEIHITAESPSPFTRLEVTQEKP